MAFLNPEYYKSAPTVTDYLNQNRKMEMESRANEQAMAMNSEKRKQEEIKNAILFATPNNYKSIRADGINRGLWSAETVPEEWDDNMMRQLKQSVGGVKSDTGFKVVGNQVVRLDESTGEVQPVYTAPSTAPINPQTGLPERKLSSTEQKELFDTIDNIESSIAAKESLSQALGILTKSPKGAEPYTGTGADLRTAAARIPYIGDIISDKERAASTKDYSNIIKEQALTSLKSIFGGMPTEGERQVLLDIQALPTFSKEEQVSTIKRAQAAADRRLQSNQKKAEAINTGAYSTMGRPRLTDTVGTQPATGERPPLSSFAR